MLLIQCHFFPKSPRREYSNLGPRVQDLSGGLLPPKDASLSTGLALETIRALIAARQAAALLLELIEADGGKRGGAVVLGGVVVDFVDGDGGVYDVRLNSLLLHHRLNGLMHMMMDMLSGDHGLHTRRMLALDADGLILKFGRLLCEVLLILLGVIVLERAVLHGDDLGVVLLGEDFLVQDGLHGGVVVVLVDFAVEGGGDVFVLGFIHGFVGYGGRDGFVDGGVVGAGLVEEGLDLFLSGVHGD